MKTRRCRGPTEPRIFVISNGLGLLWIQRSQTIIHPLVSYLTCVAYTFKT